MISQVYLHRASTLTFVLASVAFFGVDHLFRLLKSRVATAHLRPLPELEQHFTDDARLEIRASDEDVTSYLCSKMSQLSKAVQKSQQIQDDIVTTIVGAANGVLLLAQLFVDPPRDKRTLRAVKMHLERLRARTESDIYD